MTGIWEVSVGHDEDLAWWLQAVQERWPDTQVITEGAFGLEWRKHTPNNAGMNYRFDAKGTGAPGSEKDLEIQWFMNQEFRLALLSNWKTGSPPMAIDLTRYDLPAHEPDHPQREWSLMNVLNQKGNRGPRTSRFAWASCRRRPAADLCAVPRATQPCLTFRLKASACRKAPLPAGKFALRPKRFARPAHL